MLRQVLLKKLTFGAVDEQFQPVYNVPVAVPPPFDEDLHNKLDRVRRQGCRKLQDFLVDEVGTDQYSAKKILFDLEKLINSVVPSESKGEDSYQCYLDLVIKKLKVASP